MSDDDVIQLMESALHEMEQFAQPRSDFVLRHFVVGGQDLPARQRRQALEELQSLLYAIYDLRDRQGLAEVELAEIEEKGSMGKFERMRAKIRARQLRREIWHLDCQLRGREREAQTLLGILSSLPQFTAEEFEAQEAEYWRRRLTRQYVEKQLGGMGDLSSLAQLVGEPGQPMAMLPGQEKIFQSLLSGGEK